MGNLMLPLSFCRPLQLLLCTQHTCIHTYIHTYIRKSCTITVFKIIPHRHPRVIPTAAQETRLTGQPFVEMVDGLEGTRLPGMSMSINRVPLRVIIRMNIGLSGLLGLMRVCTRVLSVSWAALSRSETKALRCLSSSFTCSSYTLCLVANTLYSASQPSQKGY